MSCSCAQPTCSICTPCCPPNPCAPCGVNACVPSPPIPCPDECDIPIYTNTQCTYTTTDCVTWHQDANTCVGIVHDESLTAVINHLITYIKGAVRTRLTSDSLVIESVDDSCDDKATIEIVPSADADNILILGTDGYPYVPAPETGSGGIETVAITDTNSINLSGNGTSGSHLTADVIIDPNVQNLTTVSSAGVLSSLEYIKDVVDVISQHLIFEIPVMDQLTFDDSIGTQDATKVIIAKSPSGLYATDMSANNSNVRVWWGTSGTTEKSFDNETGSGTSLSHIYGLKAYTNEAHIKGFNGDYLTQLRASSTVIPSGFKAIRGGELITQIIYSGALLGTTGVWDFKGLYNLTTFAQSASFIDTYNGSPASRTLKNIEDLQNLTFFELYGDVNDQPVMTFTSSAFDTLRLNTSKKLINVISAKEKTALSVDLAVCSIDTLDLEESELLSFTLNNCGHLYSANINKIVFKLASILSAADELLQDSGIFDFTGTTNFSISQVNGSLANSDGGVTPTQILLPDFGVDSALRLVDMDQDWVKDEAFISLDNNALDNGSVSFIESSNARSFGDNYKQTYCNPSWAPNGGMPGGIIVTIVGGVVTVITNNNNTGYGYNTVPIITTTGPGASLNTTTVMDLLHSLDAGVLGITAGGAGYTNGQILTMTAVGSIIAPIIQVTVTAGAVTGYTITNYGEFTSLPATMTHAGGLIINLTNKFSYKRSIINNGGTGYTTTTIFKLGVTSGGGSGTGTASTAAKTAISNLHTKGWQQYW